jgi:hypothetical protein
MTQSRNTNTTLICEQCGGEFPTFPSRVKAGKKFCSVLCRRTHEDKNKLIATCGLCGGEFPSFRSQAGRTKRQFCSPGCKAVGGRVAMEEKFRNGIGVPDGNGCIPWAGAKCKSGYGMLYLTTAVGAKAKMVLAHRAAYQMANGPIPAEMDVLHSCDNPPCVNPDHLFLGTQRDNNQDMIAKGRQARGETNGRAKLTEADIASIRERYGAGRASIKSLGEEFGVTKATIRDVASGRTWKHVP